MARALGVAFAAALAAGCAPSPLEGPSAVSSGSLRSTPVLPAPLTLQSGTLRFTGTELRLARCGGSDLPVIDLSPENLLTSVYGDVAASGRPVHVDALGRVVDGRLQLVVFSRATPEGGCPPRDAPRSVWRAIGTEPHWGVRIAADGTMAISRPDGADVRASLLGASGVLTPGPSGATVQTWTAGRWEGRADDGSVVSLEVHPRVCTDGMSDARYGWQATLRSGVRSGTGCAWRAG